MLFHTAAAVALLATGAVASRAPYMPVAGLSLARRSTNGYQPEQSVCKDGNTCAEACGSQYHACASNDKDDHCYNPSIGQTCCADGTGNSCDKGYYCTHDTKANTMCCPDSMSLSECAEAYKVTGSLATNALLTTSAKPITSTASSTSSTSSASSASSTSTTSTTAFTSTTPTTTSVKSTYKTPESTSTTEAKTTSTPVYTSESVKTEALNTTTPYATTAVYTTPVGGSNGTYAAPTSAGSGSGSGSSITTSAPASTGAATATSMSALLLAAAGLLALF